MRFPAFSLSALLLPLMLSAQIVPPTADVSKSIAALTTGMTVQAITVDSTGNVYLAGTTTTGFPTATQTFGPRGDSDVFIIKTNATADQILYAVAIGSSSTDAARAVRVDASGNLYVLASTFGTDFPVTTAVNPTFPIGSILFKLNATGTALTYSSQLGSRTNALAFDIDSAGAAYISGSANALDIPTTPGVIKPSPAAGQNDTYGFIVKLAPAGNTFQIATYYGPIGKTVEAISVRSNGILISASGTLALLNNTLTQQTASADTTLAPANMTFDSTGNIYLSGTAAAGGHAVRRYDSALNLTLNKTTGFVSTSNPPRIAVASNNRIYLFGEPISPQFFQTRNATQACLVNVAPPNGAAGQLPTGSGGLFDGGNAQLPTDQGMVVMDQVGEVIHATFLSAAIAQAAVASSTGRIYTAATQTLFTSPRTTWRGILRFDPNIIPTDKASPSCVVHGAYYAPMPLAPGAIMTIYGNRLGPADFAVFQLNQQGLVPTTLAGLSVTVDNRPAPIWFTYDKQINFIVPWATRTDGAAVPVCVTYSGTTSCVQVSTTLAAPGAFPCNAVACALNQDFSINQTNNGAAPGSVVQIFMTGFGKLDSGMVDGGVAGTTLLRPVGTVTASANPPGTGGCGIFACAGGAGGFKNAEVLFAGAAPTLVLGANQVNLRIPADMPSGLQTFTINFTPTGSSTTYATDIKLQIR